MIRKFLLVSGACGLLVAGCGSFDGKSSNHGSDVEPANQLGETSTDPVKGDVDEEAPKPEQDTDLTEQSPKPDKPEIEEDDLLGQEEELEDTVTKPEEDEVVKPEEDEVVKPEEDEPGQTEPGQDEPSQDEPAQDEPAQDEPAQDEPSQDEPSQQEPVQDEPSQDDLDSVDDIEQVDQDRPIDSGVLDRVEVTDQHLADVRSVLSEMSFAELQERVLSRIDALELIAESSLDARDMDAFSVTLEEIRSKLDGLEQESADHQEAAAAKVVAAIDEIEIFLSERR